MKKLLLYLAILGGMYFHCETSLFAEQQLFIDKFEKGLSPSWSLETGWQLVTDSGNSMLRGQQHQWANLQLGQNWTDYSLTLRLKLESETIHLNYRVGPSGRYFIGFNENWISLTKESPRSNFQELYSKDVNHKKGVWHYIEIRGENGQIQVFVNKKLEIDFTDPDPLTQGRIAFETLDNSMAYVDDIKVTTIDSKLNANESIRRRILPSGVVELRFQNGHIEYRKDGKIVSSDGIPLDPILIPYIGTSSLSLPQTPSDQSSMMWLTKHAENLMIIIDFITQGDPASKNNYLEDEKKKVPDLNIFKTIHYRTQMICDLVYDMKLKQE